MRLEAETGMCLTLTARDRREIKLPTARNPLVGTRKTDYHDVPHRQPDSLFLSIGISYDINSAVLFRPGFAWRLH